MEKKQITISEILAHQWKRKYFFEKNFFAFFLYYFSKHIKFKKMASCHKQWCQEAQDNKSLYVEGHRELAKTTILWLGYVIWCICYEKKNFICSLCYDKLKAKAFNKMIVMELLQNDKLIQDFWKLFSLRKKDFNEDEITEKSINEFVTINWIKIKAFWMWEAMRWEVFNHKDKWNVRPDLVFVDDIDNIKNTKNKRIISDDMDFIKSEVFGWMDTTQWQVIWLWNIIRQDWRNPRIKQEQLKNNNWKIFSNFIYWIAWITSWKIHWERYVETEKEAKELNKWKDNDLVVSLEYIKQEQKSWYNQNYLWIPIVAWQNIIKEDWIQFNTELQNFDYYQMWLDPAFSTKTWTDAFWIVVIWFKKIKDTLYKKAVFCKKLEEEKKDTLTAINIIKSLYHKYNISMINIEWNNWWSTFANLLKNEWLAVEVINSSKDKITRLKENEWDLMRWLIYFDPDVDELVTELLEFTWEDGWDDNLVDAFVHWLKTTKKEFIFITW